MGLKSFSNLRNAQKLFEFSFYFSVACGFTGTLKAQKPYLAPILDFVPDAFQSGLNA
jgi:hypothetical protein